MRSKMPEKQITIFTRVNRQRQKESWTFHLISRRFGAFIMNSVIWGIHSVRSSAIRAMSPPSDANPTIKVGSST
jgi:hypothetical protein